MKCKIVNCDKTAVVKGTVKFECCSNIHGTLLAMARKEIPLNFSANYASQKWGNRSYTILECETYL